MKFRVSICILRLLDDIISLVPGALLEIFYVQEIIKMSIVQIYTSRFIKVFLFQLSALWLF